MTYKTLSRKDFINSHYSRHGDRVTLKPSDLPLVKQLLKQRTTLRKPDRPDYIQEFKKYCQPISKQHLRAAYHIPLDLENPLTPYNTIPGKYIVQKRCSFKTAFQDSSSVKNLFQDFATSLDSHPTPRKKNPFIDDSAIESDGEGGDIHSTTTTPSNSPPPSPKYLATPPRPTSTKVSCDLCGHTLHQKLLNKHRNSKRCRAIRQFAKPSFKCSHCPRSFNSTHDRAKHIKSKHKK